MNSKITIGPITLPGGVKIDAIVSEFEGTIEEITQMSQEFKDNLKLTVDFLKDDLPEVLDKLSDVLGDMPPPRPMPMKMPGGMPDVPKEIADLLNMLTGMPGAGMPKVMRVDINKGDTPDKLAEKLREGMKKKAQEEPSFGSDNITIKDNPAKGIRLVRQEEDKSEEDKE